ncbi:hypothetical protein [Saccharopolyspora thermophila]|uniref:hypothetical protein n=1 Tax=Saccharopolyspora thermophila TaxID=89367 RepID=UPI001E2AE0F2|nr:hypothetical protein [Saccharopolyspora subtropica]
MIDRSRLTALLVRTALFFAVAVGLAVVSGWSWYGVVAVALTGGAALLQLGGVLWLRRVEQRNPEAAKKASRPGGFR